MGSCSCHSKTEDLKALADKQAKVLWAVLIINLIMFFGEAVSGWLAGSAALMGDSLDMLGDSLAYGSSLYVLNSSLKAKAKASIFKASIMAVLGVAILGKAIHQTFFLEVPKHELMGVVGLVALVANAYCLWLLTAHKDDDINFKSVWVCSRNDIVANISVIMAGVLVFYIHSPWPDLVVGLGITLLFLKSSYGIFQEAMPSLRGS